MTLPVIGVFGSGKVAPEDARKHTKALLKDWIAGHGDALWVLAATNDVLFSAAVRHSADYLIGAGQDVVLVVSPDVPDADIEDYLDDAIVMEEVHDDAWASLLGVDHLFLAWDEERESTYEKIATEALAQGIAVYDFSDGLEPIIDDGEEAPQEAPEAAEPEPVREVLPEPESEPEKPAEEVADEAQTLGLGRQTSLGSPVVALGSPVVDVEAIAQAVSQRALEILLERLSRA